MSDHPRRRDDLEINPVDDGYVVFDPASDRVVHLNRTAAVVLEFCLGDQSPAEIAESVRAAYGLDDGVEAPVLDCLAQLRREGLLQPGT